MFSVADFAGAVKQVGGQGPAGSAILAEKLVSLDNDHITERGFGSFEGVPGGLRVNRGFKGAGCVGGGARGVVRGFSDGSRRRMIDKMMGVDWAALAVGDPRAVYSRALFLTLTYPGVFPDGWVEVKADLDAFEMRLRRSRWPVEGVVWKLEKQKRGAFHFHLVVVFSREVAAPAFREWARRAWFEVVGSGDSRHYEHGVDVKVVYGGARGIMGYLCKYLGKEWAADKPTGRVWGVWGELPEGKVVKVEFRTWQAWVEFTRRVRRWGRGSRYVGIINSRFRGFRLFGDGYLLCSLVRGLDVDVCSEVGNVRKCGQVGLIRGVTLATWCSGGG